MSRAIVCNSFAESCGDPRPIRSASVPSLCARFAAMWSSRVFAIDLSLFTRDHRAYGVTPSKWNIPQAPDEASDAPNHLRSSSVPRKPRKNGSPSPTRSPATSPINE